MNLDLAVVLFLNQLAVSSSALSAATVFLAHYLPWMIAAAFVVFVTTTPALGSSRSNLVSGERLNLFPQKWGIATSLAEGFGGAVVAWGVSQLVEMLTHRLRPFVADASIVALFEKTSYSFPSGHATFFFALATVVWLRDKRLGALFYAAAALIGAARIAAGVHYPSDILGGAALGMLVGYLARRFFRRRFQMW